GKLIQEVEYDYYYINSLFSFRFALLPLWLLKRKGLSSKVVLAPRGMLKTGALSVKSRKKTLFLKLARKFNLFNGITWHATNFDEKYEISSHFPGASVKVAQNLVLMPKERANFPKKKKGSLRLVTVSRVSPEKNTLGALQYLDAAFTPDDDIQFDIYGTLQNEAYLDECKAIAAKFKDRIRFMGPIASSKIPETLMRYHFFYLPTLGENFGHAIIEALMQGMPVLISNKTPWRGLVKSNAGAELPLETDDFVPALHEALEMDQELFDEKSQGAYSYALEKVGHSAGVRDNYQLFPRIESIETES
ncbi:MAG: glycosyltransferase, partial [Flavobacteriales bacterium]|nr:glycosyltransferase [Flavobacteriales bacterium]